jgi:AraC-like DNA-binding protein
MLRTADEFIAVVEALRGWDAEVIQLQPRRAPTSVLWIESPAYKLVTLRPRSTQVFRGRVPDNTCVALLSSSHAVPIRLWGRELCRDLPVMAGPGSKVDLLMQSGARLCVLELASPSPVAANTLRICEPAAVTRTHAGLELARCMRRAERAPLDLEMVRALFREACASSRRWFPENRLNSVRVSAVIGACEFLNRLGNSQIRMGDLSRRCGVSARTLEYGFRQVYGTTPVSFARSQRLSRSRAALLGPGGRSAIGTTAQTFGFTHMGQYSRDYRLLFMETPTSTAACGCGIPSATGTLVHRAR